MEGKRGVLMAKARAKPRKTQKAASSWRGWARRSSRRKVGLPERSLAPRTAASMGKEPTRVKRTKV